MVQKEYSKIGDSVKVVFELPSDVEGKTVYLVGDFNDWKPVQQMERAGECWHCAIELEPGREYQFRYLVDGETWLNDPAADKYVPNPFGSENSVVVVVKPEA